MTSHKVEPHFATLILAQSHVGATSSWCMENCMISVESGVLVVIHFLAVQLFVSLFQMQKRARTLIGVLPSSSDDSVNGKHMNTRQLGSWCVNWFVQLIIQTSHDLQICDHCSIGSNWDSYFFVKNTLTLAIQFFVTRFITWNKRYLKTMLTVNQCFKHGLFFLVTKINMAIYMSFLCGMQGPTDIVI